MAAVSTSLENSPSIDDPLFYQAATNTGRCRAENAERAAELTALARAYGVEIRVLQDGRTETIAPGGEAAPEPPKRIWLAYYRHGYGLGEHYNSLRQAA